MRAHNLVSVLVASLGLVGAACVVSKSPLGEPTPQGDDTSTGGTTSGATGQASMSSTSVDPPDDSGDVIRLDVYPGNSGEPPDDESGNVDDGVPLDVWGGGCAGAGVAACYDQVLDACSGRGGWSVDEACVDAVDACYPYTFFPLALADVVEACHAELEPGCTAANAPGCGEALCECTRGVFPYDPTDCWDLLWLGCGPSSQSDCQAAIDSCFAGITIPTYEACREDVLAAHPQCSCASCAMHEICAEALADCLGA